MNKYPIRKRRLARGRAGGEAAAQSQDGKAMNMFGRDSERCIHIFIRGRKGGGGETEGASLIKGD